MFEEREGCDPFYFFSFEKDAMLGIWTWRSIGELSGLEYSLAIFLAILLSCLVSSRLLLQISFWSCYEGMNWSARIFLSCGQFNLSKPDWQGYDLLVIWLSVFLSGSQNYVLTIPRCLKFFEDHVCFVCWGFRDIS